MASNSPPSGWNVEEGTWGTDFEREETLNVHGASAIKVVGGGSTSRTITTDWIRLADNSLGRGQIEAWAWLRADSITAPAGTVSVVTQVATGSIPSAGGGTALFSGTLAAINTWEVGSTVTFPGTTARWVRLAFTFAATATAEFIIGGYTITLQKPRLRGIPDTVVLGTLNTWTKVPLISSSAYLISVNGSDELEYLEPGPHSVSAGVAVSNIGAGEIFDIRLCHTDSLGTFYYYGGSFESSVAESAEVYLHVTGVPQVISVSTGRTHVEVRQRNGTLRQVGGLGSLVVDKLSN